MQVKKPKSHILMTAQAKSFQAKHTRKIMTNHVFADLVYILTENDS